MESIFVFEIVTGLKAGVGSGGTVLISPNAFLTLSPLSSKWANLNLLHFENLQVKIYLAILQVKHSDKEQQNTH